VSKVLQSPYHKLTGHSPPLPDPFLPPPPPPQYTHKLAPPSPDDVIMSIESPTHSPPPIPPNPREAPQPTSPSSTPFMHRTHQHKSHGGKQPIEDISRPMSPPFTFHQLRWPKETANVKTRLRCAILNYLQRVDLENSEIIIVSVISSNVPLEDQPWTSSEQDHLVARTELLSLSKAYLNYL
jgi:hypothetical protein